MSCGRMALVLKVTVALKMKNFMLLYFALAVMFQQQERFVDLLAMAPIKAVQSVKNFSQGQLVLKLIFLDLSHVIQGATLNIDRKHRRF